MLNHLVTDCSLPPATFHDLRLVKKCIFSCEIEVIERNEGLNLSHGSCTHNSFTFFFTFFDLEQ
jgi:hypothetical protein